MKFQLLYVVLFCLNTLAFSNESLDTISTHTEGTAKDTFQSWALLPVLISSEETSWRFGAFVAYFIEQKDTTLNTSSIEAAGYYTLKNQLNVSAKPNFYWDTYHFQTDLYYELWPANYYGVGMRDTKDSTAFDSKNFGFELLFEKKVFSKLSIGVNYEGVSETITPKDSVLKTTQTVGATGARTSGLGFLITYDNKNHQYWATAGEEVALKTFAFSTLLGSEFSFLRYQLTAKKFYSLGKGAVAAKLTNEVNYGSSIPFRSLATPDGIYVMRGIENGRYRDNNLVSIGAEYRREIWWRISGVAFTEAFQVWGQRTNFEVSNTLYSIGGGLRFALNPQQKFNVRGDISYVQESGIGLTVYIREAF